MDYQVAGKAPDTAQAMVLHAVDPVTGLASPASTTAPMASAQPINIRVAATQTVTATAYAAGNVVGGLIAFANAVRLAGQGGTIQTGLLRDKAGQAGAYDLFLFDSAPTTPTDKTAVALAAADLAKCIGVLKFPGATIALGAAATMGAITAGSQNIAFKLSGGTTLYGILVTRGTPTYAGTADVSVDLVIWPD